MLHRIRKASFNHLFKRHHLEFEEVAAIIPKITNNKEANLDSDWWEKLSYHEQQVYVTNHPKTHFKPTFNVKKVPLGAKEAFEKYWNSLKNNERLFKPGYRKSFYNDYDNDNKNPEVKKPINLEGTKAYHRVIKNLKPYNKANADSFIAFHHTSLKSAQSIAKSGKMRSGMNGLYFMLKPNTSYGKEWGDTMIAVRIKYSDLLKTDIESQKTNDGKGIIADSDSMGFEGVKGIPVKVVGIYRGKEKVSIEKSSNLEEVAAIIPNKEASLDLDWWHELSGKEQAKYLKAHPGSKYNEHFHLGDGSDIPFDPSYFKGQLKNIRRIKIPLSHHAGHDLPEGRWNYHQHKGEKPTLMSIAPEKLRATQMVVDNRWTPAYSKKTNKWTIPRGLMNKNGFVHILDGHHRAEYNYLKGKPTKILVYKHSTEDENAVKHNPKYNDGFEG